MGVATQGLQWGEEGKRRGGGAKHWHVLSWKYQHLSIVPNTGSHHSTLPMSNNMGPPQHLPPLSLSPPLLWHSVELPRVYFPIFTAATLQGYSLWFRCCFAGGLGYVPKYNCQLSVTLHCDSRGVCWVTVNCDLWTPCEFSAWTPNELGTTVLKHTLIIN